MHRYTCLALALALLLPVCLHRPADAQFQLRLLRSFNISALFDGTDTAGGDAAIDVAFDGVNAYVAGFRYETGVGPVGVVRIDNVFSLPSGSLTFGPGVTKIIGERAAGGSRDTRLVYDNGFLYLGVGLGHGTNPDTAIRTYNTFGVWQSTWSGDGILSLADMPGMARYDSIEADPGFGAAGPALAVAPLAAGVNPAMRRVDFATGSVVGLTTGFLPTYLRDITFAPNGDLYVHRSSPDANDGIFLAVRTGATSFATPVRIVSFDEGNFQQCTVTYVPVSLVYASLPDLLAYNFRVTPVDPATCKLFLAAPNGAPLGEWDGSGTTEDGVQAARFSHNLINACYYITQTGRMLLFVVSGQVAASPAGTIDRLDVLEITPTVKITGMVVLGDYGGDVTRVPVLVEIRRPGETTPLEVHEVYPESNGAYELITGINGVHDVGAKASHWLRRVNYSVNLSGEVVVHFHLTNGDIDGDNEVTLLDFGALVAAFGAMPGDSNWNPNADLDGDDEVTLLDFGILVGNFGAVGDE